MNTLILNTKNSRFIFLAGENVISNRETEIAKALWSPGIYHRALDYFQTLKLKSGGLILRLSCELRRAKPFFSLPLLTTITAHLPLHRQHRIRHHPHQRRDHHREIKDYHRPPAVFIRNQLQASRA